MERLLLPLVLSVGSWLISWFVMWVLHEAAAKSNFTLKMLFLIWAMLSPRTETTYSKPD